MEEEQQFQSDYEKLKNCYRLTFSFDSRLTSFVIGKSGANIMQAKSINGVEHVNIKQVSSDLSECLILAVDQEAADEAREHLEMEMATERIPRSVLPDVIGNKGDNITKLERRTNVALISTLAHFYRKMQDDSYEFDPNDENIEMVIIGPKVNVPVARSALQSEVKRILQKKDYVQRSQSARLKLKQYQKDDVSAQYNNYDEEFDEQGNYDQANYDNQQRSYRRQQRDNQSRNYKGQGQGQGQGYYNTTSNVANDKQNDIAQYYENPEATNDFEQQFDYNVNQDNGNYEDDGNYDDDVNNVEYDEHQEYNEQLQQNTNEQSYNYHQKGSRRSRGRSGYQRNYGSPRTGNYQRGATTPTTKKIYVKKQSTETGDTQ